MEGLLMSDKKTIKIRYEYPNGNVYEGETESVDIPDGRGRFTYVHKDVYEGAYVNGKRNGKGKYTFANGNTYEGEFVDDSFNGKGRYTFPDGRSYSGIWENNKCIEKTERISNQFEGKYEGEIEDGFPHGKGKLIDDGIVYEGTFIEGIKNGHFIEYPEANPDRKKEVLYNCGYPVDLSDYQWKSADLEYSSYPIVSGKNVGNCLKLTGRVTVIVVYADDGESSWNTKDKEAYRHIIYESLDYLETSAKEYRAELDFSIVEKDDEYRNTLNWPPSQEFFNEYYSKINNYKSISTKVMESENTPQTAMMLVFNKNFTSYSYMKDVANDSRYEVSFIGAKADLKNQIAHELLHLFGAQDLYRTEEMLNLTAAYYPISIMHKTSDVFLPVDEVTAYLIGWAEGLSERATDFVKKTKFVKIRPEEEDQS